jgi:hypothetical protein
MTIVADGSHTVAYSSIDRVAWSVPGAGAIGWPVGFGVAFSVNGTIAQLVANMNQRVHGTHARLLGERTIDGRATYLVKAWPATRISSGGCSNAQECLRKSHGYGYTLLWLDKDHMTTLRYELRGPRAQVQRLVYRVTSITYGAGPTQAELAFQPPVPVQHPGNGDEFSTGSGGTFGGISGKWIPSGGFLPADAPRNAQGHPLLQANSGTEDSAITRKPVGVDVLFAAHVSSIVTRRALRGGPTASGTYVYLEEHLRLNGIAPFFTAGIPHRSGGCSVWTGSYNNGFRWLGMQRGRVGIMLTSNSLSQGQLVTYARTQFCK